MKLDLSKLRAWGDVVFAAIVIVGVGSILVHMFLDRPAPCAYEVHIVTQFGASCEPRQIGHISKDAAGYTMLICECKP